MQKNKFVKEYEIRASPRLLFQYISTEQGLGQWFADKASYDKTTDTFDFIWENTSHLAKLTHQKLNKFARFDFLNSEQEDNPSYIEFRLESSELTNALFLKITDYSSASEEDAHELWDGLIHSLKEIIAG